MVRHRSHRAAFKRQVAEEFLAGETLHRATGLILPVVLESVSNRPVNEQACGAG